MEYMHTNTIIFATLSSLCKIGPLILVLTGFGWSSTWTALPFVSPAISLVIQSFASLVCLSSVVGTNNPQSTIILVDCSLLHFAAVFISSWSPSPSMSTSSFLRTPAILRPSPLQIPTGNEITLVRIDLIAMLQLLEPLLMLSVSLL